MDHNQMCFSKGGGVDDNNRMIDLRLPKYSNVQIYY